MGWEKRGNGGLYYYRKQRQGGKVISVYASRWRTGGIAARNDQDERQATKRQRAAFQQFVCSQRQIDREIDDYRRQVRTVVNGVLEAAGCHRHKGQWRVKRGSMTTEIETLRNNIDTYTRLHKAAGNVNPGDPERLEFEHFTLAHPEVYRGLATLADQTTWQLIAEHYAGVDEIHLKGEVRAMQRNLRGDHSTPLEDLLIRDVVMCWLRVQFMESTYTKNYYTGNGVSLEKAAYLENRLSATRRRYLQAVEGLARVRRLLARPDVQINIAQQQVVQNTVGH